MRPLIFLTLICALPLCAQAQAQGLRGEIFPSDGACFLRYYDDSHMAAHPQQRVVEIAVGPDAAQTTVASLALRLMVRTRDSGDFFTAVAYCTDGGDRLNCSIEGDGGGFTLQQNDRALQLHVKLSGMTLQSYTGFVQISGSKGDDRTFRLPPVPADSCP
jgi:hypothetical protein